VVGTVGVLRPQKAFHVLIEAVARVLPRFPELRLVIGGDGPELGRLEALVDELDVRHAVILAGYRSDVPDLLAAFDIAASSSDFEGSPLAVIEYMDAGKPIVATRVGGVPDLIEDGVHGLLAPPGDAAALAQALERLLADRELAGRLGAAARERRLAELSFDNTVRAVEGLYEELYARTKRARTEGFVPAPQHESRLAAVDR
jgi:glycosyltransferase involved in cell wall biosynthesis